MSLMSYHMKRKPETVKTGVKTEVTKLKLKFTRLPFYPFTQIKSEIWSV